MKIALVGLTYPFRGGISHYTTLLYEALAKRHDVRLFALRRQYPTFLFPGKTQTDESGKTLVVPHDPCLDSINPISWLQTYGRIRQYHPDLTLFCWWNPFFAPAFGTIARLLTTRAKIPCCFLCHNVLPHESTRLDRILLRYVLRPGAAFITHSAADKANIERICPDARVYRNPHPTYEIFRFDHTLTGVTAKAKLGLENKKVVLFFGYIREYKGLQYLLDAMAMLPTEDGYHLLVVGEFYEPQVKYRNRLNELQRSQRLTLVDRYMPNEEVAQYFIAADVVVAPYLSATQSGIIQIAYSFDKPVIATTVGGLPEVVIDGETGYLIPPADAPRIAGALRELFAPGQAERFAKRIRQEQQRYSWEQMVATIETMAGALRG